MKKFITSIFISLISFISLTQIPQNINPGTENKESMWESPITIVVIAVFILLLVVSRTWAKRILRKRDDISGRNKEEDSDSESDEVKK